MTLQVQRAGDQLLARPALTQDEDRALGWRYLGDELEDALHLRRRP
jgi:hypothetical protein